jgi:serine/threonine-protein kinase
VGGGLTALREAQQLTRALYGPDHPDSIRLLRNLGRNAQRRDALDEAYAHFDEGWTRAQRVFQAPHVVRVLLAHPLALARLHRRDIAGAASLMRQAASESEQLFPPAHPSRATVAADLALILLEAGDHDEARRHAEAALAARREAGDTDASIAQPELVLAVLDCLAAPSEDGSGAVSAALARVQADRGLVPAVMEDYAHAAVRCAVE